MSVPIGREEYVLKRATQVVREGGPDRLARSLDCMPDKKAATLIAVGPSGRIQRTEDRGQANSEGF